MSLMPNSPTLEPLEPHSDVVQTPAPEKDSKDCPKEAGFMSLPEELIVKTLRVVALGKRNEGDAFGER